MNPYRIPAPRTLTPVRVPAFVRVGEVLVAASWIASVSDHDVVRRDGVVYQVTTAQAEEVALSLGWESPVKVEVES